jgi:hypothetical protein
MTKVSGLDAQNAYARLLGKEAIVGRAARIQSYHYLNEYKGINDKPLLSTVTIYSNQDKRTYVLLVSHNVPH